MKQNRERMRKNRMCSSWSQLPGKIIRKISKNLKTRDDILRFRRVCFQWRKRSVSLPQTLLSYNIPLPKTMIDSSNVFPFHTFENPLVLQVSSIYLITPCRNETNDQSSSAVSLKPWMVMVEESKLGRVKLRHALTATRVRDFPAQLDMTRFQISELAQGYTFKSSSCVRNVLLCSSSANSLEVMVLYSKGGLGKVSLDVLESGAAKHGNRGSDDSEDEEEVSYSWKKLKTWKWGKVLFLYLDDIVRFKDKYFGLDRKGKLYELNPGSMTVAHVLVSEPICRGDMPNNRRKRLVVEPTSGELHLVVRERLQETCKVRFKVYKLNETGEKWDVVQNIGSDRVLFVGVDHCFFAKYIPGCRGNSIVFASNCFTQYCGRDAPDPSLFPDEGVGIGIYRLGRGDNFSLLTSAYPEFAQIIWPPPTWFSAQRRESDEADMEEEPVCQQSDELALSSFVSLTQNHKEGLLSGSSSDRNLTGGSTSVVNDDDGDKSAAILSDCSGNADADAHEDEDEDEEDDDEMESSDCSGTADSEASNKSRNSHILKVITKKEQISYSSEDLCDSDADFSDHLEVTPSKPVTKEKPMNKRSATIRTRKRVDQACEEGSDFGEEKAFVASTTPPLTRSVLKPVAKDKPMNKHSGSIRTRKRDDQTREEGLVFAEERAFVATATQPLIPAALLAGQKGSTVKFQGVEIRSELFPTLQTIWAKHGDLIGEHTVRRKMLAGALEDLAELYITLKNSTARTLTDAQTADMRSVLSDIQRAGLKVDWLQSAIENAVTVQKSKTFIESIAALEKKKAKIEQEERKALAKIAKDKQELEDSIACLSARVPFPEDQIIDLDDCLGEGL